MKEIGFKNFRRFADEVRIPLGDINLLVGGNNSGKSTVVKATLLITSNLFKFALNDSLNRFNDGEWSLPMFDFAPGNLHDVLHIGTFSRAVNVNNRNQDIILTAAYGTKEQIKIRLTIGKPAQQELSTAPVYKIVIESDNGLSIKIDYRAKDVTFTFSHDVFASPMESRESFLNTNIRDYLKKYEKEHLILPPYSLEKVEELSFMLDKISPEELYNDMQEGQDGEKVKTRFTPDELFAFFKSIYNEEIDRLKNFIEKVKQQLELGKKLGIDNGLTIKLPFSVCLSSRASFPVPFLLPSRRVINRHQRDFDAELNDIKHIDHIEFLNSKAELLDNFTRNIMQYLRNPAIEYIYAHSVSQSTLYPINSRTDYMSRTIQDFFYSGIEPNSVEMKFVRDWLAKFGIASNIAIRTIAGCEAYTVKIGNTEDIDETWENLAEKGMGSIQLTILLLRIASIIRKYNCDKINTFHSRSNKLLIRRHGIQGQPMILIEEPEQNLHPKTQSLLADLFSDINKKFFIRMIVETHSEYLIRRAQVLCGDINETEGNRASNPFKVFYFPEEGSPYEMGMETSGHFINNFNEGFFDVAAKLNMTVSRRERKRIKPC